VNSYERELRFSPLEFLLNRCAAGKTVRWLDLCCGTGKALLDAAALLQSHAGQFELIGVDLMPTFVASHTRVGSEHVRYVTSSVAAYVPDAPCDLVTCVHGLHYLGDKLAAIARAISRLSPDGLFAAHLDLNNVRRKDGRSLNRGVLKWMRGAGIDFDRRTHLVTCRGPRAIEVPFEFVGADDTAGPNFTHQPAVDSFYRVTSRHGSA
jgi:trans-aconitate methyltransferase